MVNCTTRHSTAKTGRGREHCFHFSCSLYSVLVSRSLLDLGTTRTCTHTTMLLALILVHILLILVHILFILVSILAPRPASSVQGALPDLRLRLRLPTSNGSVVVLLSLFSSPTLRPPSTTTSTATPRCSSAPAAPAPAGPSAQPSSQLQAPCMAAWAQQMRVMHWILRQGARASRLPV